MSFPRLPSITEWQAMCPKGVDINIRNAVAMLLENVYRAQTIYARIDNLIELFDITGKADVPGCKEINSIVMDIMMHILDDNNPQSVTEKLQARKTIRKFDPCFIPWRRPYISDELPNDTIAFYQRISRTENDENATDEAIRLAFQQQEKKLLAHNSTLLRIDQLQDIEDSKYEIKYFDNTEIEKFRVIPHNGKLIRLITEDKNINDCHLTFEYFNSSDLHIESVGIFDESTSCTKNRGIYVIDVNGGIFAGSSVHPRCISKLATLVFESKALLHTSYAAHMKTGPFMAGQIGGVADGIVGEIDAGSGHFKPGSEQWKRATNFLKELRLLRNNTRLQFFHPVTQKFIPHNYSVDEFTIYSFIMSNELKVSSVTLQYLQQNNPPLYNRYVLQCEINNQNAIWQEDSNVVFNKPSAYTKRLNDAVEKYSAFARINDIDTAMILLQNALQEIAAWKQYHSQQGKSSRRKHAVLDLEIRLLRHAIHFKLQKICALARQDNRLISDFLTFRITKDEFFAALSASATVPQPSEQHDSVILSRLKGLNKLTAEEMLRSLDEILLDHSKHNISPSPRLARR